MQRQPTLGNYLFSPLHRPAIITARRAYEKNTRLSSAEIGKAIGRSRQTVDSYIADLRASTELEMDLKIFRMNRVDIPKERIALRLGQSRDIIRMHLGKMPVLAKSPNTDLSKGFTVPQVAEKHVWVEPLVWSIALEGKDDLDRFKALNPDVAEEFTLNARQRCNTKMLPLFLEVARLIIKEQNQVF